MFRKWRKDEINPENFICVRLTSEDKHKPLINGFSSKRNMGLALYLQRKAWHEDSKNYRAYYLVRDGEKIVLYYSLQCGLLIKSHRKVLHGIVHKEKNGETEYYVDEDKINVTKVIPAVELAHFCVNDSYRRKKQSWILKKGLDQYSVGAYVFYEYIAPQIISLASLVGVQYVYLFCADDGSDSLSRYYSDVLHFDVMDDMACVRSEYDATLECMTAKVSDIQLYRNRFTDMDKLPLVLRFLQENGTISTHQAKTKFNVEDVQYLFTRIVQCELAESVAFAKEGYPLRLKKLR